MKRLVIALTCLVAGGAYARPENTSAANAKRIDGKTQTWKAPGTLARALIQSPLPIPGMHISGEINKDLIDELSSECWARVVRPEDVSPTISSANELICTVYDADGNVAELSVDVTNVPFKRWGNRRDETFQIVNHDANLALFRALRHLNKQDHPHVSALSLCDNATGKLCTSQYSVNTEDGSGRSHLSCIVDVEGDDVYRTRCIFFYPENFESMMPKD